MIDKLKTKLFISKLEIEKGLPRLSFVYDFLKEKARTDNKYKIALYLIMDHAVLCTSSRAELYQKSDGRHSLKDILKQFRLKLLSDYLYDYNLEKPFILSLLLDYIWEKRELKYPEIDDDFPNIHNIIESYMDPACFKECYFVNKYIDMVRHRTSSYETELKELRIKYKSSTYDLYSLLSMKYNLSGDAHTWEEFHQLKIKTISKNILIESLGDFIKIYDELTIIMDFKKYRGDIGDGISILLRNILSKNIKVGMECLDYYLKNGNIVSLSGASVFWPIFSRDTAKVNDLYELITKYKYLYKNEWINNFFILYPEEQITQKTIDNLVAFYITHDGPLDIYTSHYAKYELFQTGTKERLLDALFANRKINEEFIYKLGYNFFQESPEILKSNLELCQNAYFQQEEMPGNYDQDGKELMVLIRKNILFFDKFFDWYIDTTAKEYINENKILNRIWELDFSPDLVYRSLVKIPNIKPFVRSEHLACIFFYSIKEEHHEKAHGVLEKIIKDFPNDSHMLNMVLDTARNSFQQFYIPIIQRILLQNDDISLFMKLQFHNNHFSTSSGEIWPERKAKELNKIKSAILSMPIHYKYFKHKSYLDERILKENQYAQIERKHIFRGFW